MLADRIGRPLASPHGLYAQFAAPSGVAGPVDARRLSKAVDDKVKRYASLADELEVPLVVAVGAHRFTGVDLSNVDALIAGQPVVSFQFNIGDTYIGEKTVNLEYPPRWTMPTGLAGLLWLHNQPPFGATTRCNLQGRRPMLAALVEIARTAAPTLP